MVYVWGWAMRGMSSTGNTLQTHLAIATKFHLRSQWLLLNTSNLWKSCQFTKWFHGYTSAIYYCNSSLMIFAVADSRHYDRGSSFRTQMIINLYNIAVLMQWSNCRPLNCSSRTKTHMSRYRTPTLFTATIFFNVQCRPSPLNLCKFPICLIYGLEPYNIVFFVGVAPFFQMLFMRWDSRVFFMPPSLFSFYALSLITQK